LNFGEKHYFFRFWLGKGRKVPFVSQKSGEAALAGSKPTKQQSGIQNPDIFQEMIKIFHKKNQTQNQTNIGVSENIRK
jgi:hypothetical protein